MSVDVLLGATDTEEGRVHADERRPLLARDAVVLARAHRELANVVHLSELAESAKVRTRPFRIVRPRRHRHQAQSSGIAREELAERIGSYTGLRRLPAQVDLDQRR